MTKSTHFHSSDARFCNAKEKLRHFSLVDDDVTCPTCLDNAGLTAPTEQLKDSE